ncbi:PREDICTED: arogenate dehydratase/prephenate dehydratase 6, chloroplastic-like [Nelumbo nucifera]|uniref:Arogenate dehydratase/prephenate dehydratase 6, chloroplastic-like n=1 Tax=Nelumbo nucifera TaxID=4432 RepID=A0A1U7ZR69_NELNU|nr:PREDICTED: arogenate dehydratase/prephenate dehydratase 6, chloroplastic-like [Nelumbo nucifera]
MHGSQLSVAYQGVSEAYMKLLQARPPPNARPSLVTNSKWRGISSNGALDRRSGRLARRELAGGSIHQNYDMLLCHRLHIMGECELTLNKMGLNVVQEAVDDMAGVAEFVVTNNLRDTTAIASAQAAELYGLEVLANGIQDDSSNVTQFMMLA